MGFLIQHDYDQIISQADLNTIIDNDSHILDEAMDATQREMESYLRDRFDVSQMFFDVFEYEVGKTYAVGNVVHLDADPWKNGGLYDVGELVSFGLENNDVHRCIQDTTNAHEQPGVDLAYWRLIGDRDAIYTTTATADDKDPNDTSFFTKKDARDPHLIRMFVDLMIYELHSRINPRNIPTFRIERHDDVIQYLRDVANPRKNITPDFPKNDPGTNKGFDISFGTSSNSSNHSY